MPNPPSKRPQLGSRKPKTGKTAILQHEAEIAEKVGGVPQPNSGALAHRKADVSVDGESVFSSERFLLDSKETMGSTIILGMGDVTKVCREALEVRKEPGLILTFRQCPQIVPNEWAVVPLDVFADMLARLRNSET